MYQQILALRSESNAPQRGYKFEQIIREILPWSFRPPLATLSESEQLDAFFEWNSWHFLVESKAKETTIKRGDHDWEDFELKVRKRQGSCIGLFCSLYSVAETVEAAAVDLNRQGITTLVLHGDLWDKMADEQLPFDVLLRFMVLTARSKFTATPPEPSQIRSWVFDRERIATQLTAECRDQSGLFLRRHKHPKHGDVYVRRKIDSYLESMTQLLHPSSLATTRKEKTVHETSFVQQREKPRQICIFRDDSGAGKTTFAVNIALTNDKFFGISRAALDSNVDVLGCFSRREDSMSTLQKLVTVDRPIVYAVDSLDEANAAYDKKKEIASLIRLLEELNQYASDIGLLAYPIALVFTVREDYWRDWESIFEGQPNTTFLNKFSYFNAEEFDDAFTRYSNAYHFALTSTPSQEARALLSVPFNLQVFSEAYEFVASVSTLGILEHHVLGVYFDKKRDNIVRRRIPSLYAETFMRLASALAMKCVNNRSNSLPRRDILDSISLTDANLSRVADDVLIALRSDHIIQQDADKVGSFRFRHSRFLEYLLAYFIVSKVARSYSPGEIDSFTTEVFNSRLISMFKVHAFIRAICRTEFPELQDVIQNHYAQSSAFMGPLVRSLRYSVALGQSTSDEHLALILKNAESSDPEVAWDSFFVLAAKRNIQPPEVLLTAFELAWQSNTARTDRWKLIDKLSCYGFLLVESVFVRLLESRVPKEWEVFLGCALENKSELEFQRMWQALAGPKMERELKGGETVEWKITMKLLDCLIHGTPYVRGEAL